MLQHRHDADREVAGDAAADLEEADRALAARRLIPVREAHHVLDAAANGVDVIDVAGNAVAGVDVAERRVLPARHEHRQVALGGRDHPAIARIDLEMLLEHTRAQDLEHELVREELLLRLVGALPLVEHGFLDAANRLVLGDASIRDAVQVLIEQLLFLLRRKMPVVRDADVVVVRDEVEDVFLEIGARAGDRVHLAAADHFRERQAKLGGAHGTRQRDEHLPAGVEMPHVGIRGVDESGAVEMPIVMADEIRDRTHRNTSGA